MAGEVGALTPHEGDLEPGEDYDGYLFASASFDDNAAESCLFLDCAFNNVSFGRGRLRRSRFTDVTMRDTRFVSTDLAETGWQDVTLTGSALAGVQAFSASTRRVTFRDCKLDSPTRYAAIDPMPVIDRTKARFTPLRPFTVPFRGP